MNFAIIGYGYTGQQHARALSRIPGVTLRAVAEQDVTKRKQITVRALADYRPLLEDPQIDAVSVCLPHHLHEKVASLALQARKHVLVEKPLAIDVAGGKRLCRLSRKVQKVLMIEMTHRFLPPLQEAQKLVASDVIGRVIAVDEYLIEGIGLFGSLPEWMLRRTKAGGGVALTSGIHLLDHIAWICGRPLTLKAACFGDAQKLGDVEDTAALFLELPDGTPVHIVLCWRKEDSTVDCQLTIVGSKGTLKVSPWGTLSLVTREDSMSRSFFQKNLNTAERALLGMKSALKEFIEAVKKSRPPIPAPEDSLVSQALIEQGYQHWNETHRRSLDACSRGQ
jgi:predicted dehydrogenase